MSRPKNVIKKELWEGQPLIKLWGFAAYGKDADSKELREAKSMVSDLSESVFLEQGFQVLANKGMCWPGVNNPEEHQMEEAAHNRKVWERLMEIFRKAIETGNGDVFKAMGVVIEKIEKPVDPVREFIGRDLQFCYQSKRPPPTIQQMVDKVNRAKIKDSDGQVITTSYTPVRRIFGYFGIRPSPGKPGHPKTRGR